MFACSRLVLAALCVSALPAAALTTVDIAYLEETRPPVTPLANLEPPPADLGRAGVELGIRDNDSTGKFLQQRFQLHSIQLPAGVPASEWMARLSKTKARLVVLNLPASTLEALLKQPGQEGMLWFNAGAADDRLRQSECKPNLLHTLPGRAMQADALAQYLVAKRWKKWFLVSGPQPEDAAYAA